MFLYHSLFLHRSFIVHRLFVFAVMPSCVAFAVVVVELLLPYPRLFFDCCVVVVVFVVPCPCPPHPHCCPSSSLSLFPVLILHPCHVSSFFFIVVSSLIDPCPHPPQYPLSSLIVLSVVLVLVIIPCCLLLSSLGPPLLPLLRHPWTLCVDLCVVCHTQTPWGQNLYQFH